MLRDRNTWWILLFLTACGQTLIPVAAAQTTDRADLQELIDTIARGDEVESLDAERELIGRWVDPLTEAIGSLDRRPVAEQLRLRRTLQRLERELRMRMVRIDLPPDDRRLFDEFARSRPELVLELFDSNYRVRKAALHRIPLEPNSGAGVLIATRVNDEDEDVAAAALELALRLHDRVVARNLTRYVADATAAIRSGFYGPADRDLAQAVALIVFKCIRVLELAQARQSAPVVRDALDYFGHSPYWDVHQRAETIRILGRLGSASAAECLLAYLNDTALHRWRNPPDGQRLTQTVGDAALLALCRVLGQQPGRFGLLTADDDPTFAGYRSSEDRRRGHARFREWYAAHRSTPQSQPANGPRP